MKGRSWILTGTILLLWGLADPLAAQSSAGEPVEPRAERGEGDEPASRPRPLARVRFKKRPSLEVGRALRMDFTAKLQGDARDTSPRPGADEAGFGLQRRRFGVSGTLWKRLDFEVEREIDSSHPWRDAFVNLHPNRAFQIRAGQFKVPFSLDQLTSASDLDFVYRSRAADSLAPGRSIGASLHGRIAGRIMTYDVGLFRRDGEVARFGSNPGAGWTAAGRVTIRPFRPAGKDGPFRSLEIGVGATSGDVPEGRHSLRGRLASHDVFFAPVFVNGRRLRLGADLDWRPGPFSLRAELLRVEDERRGQGLAGDTLPPLRSDGWYVGGTWRPAGTPAGGVTQRFVDLRSVELAARVERLAFGSFATDEPALRNPRAAHLMEMSDRTWTVGVNWYLNQWVKVQVNAIRDQVNDPARSPIAGRDVFWTRVCRLQFAM